MRQELLKHFQNLLQLQKPFFLLREAGNSQVRVLAQQDKMLHHTRSETVASAVMAAFEPDKTSVVIHGHEDTYFDWELQKTKEADFKINTQLFDFAEQRDRHVQLVASAIHSLKQGSLQKVVLSRKQTIETSLDQIQILKNLLDSYPMANCYFFYHPKHSSWMGATPEVLLSVNNDQLTTMSLAGTALNKNGAAHHWGDKEKEEQQLVTDYIVSNLQTTGATHIEITPARTAVAGSLLHLRSDIKAYINTQELPNYLKALHPTPAVCGLPRTQALAYILENEDYDRSFYTGYFGIVDARSKQVNFFVNLRCMRLEDNSAEVFVGGGITAKSNAVDEYEETLNKLKTMATLLISGSV